MSLIKTTSNVRVSTPGRNKVLATRSSHPPFFHPSNPRAYARFCGPKGAVCDALWSEMWGKTDGVQCSRLFDSTNLPSRLPPHIRLRDTSLRTCLRRGACTRRNDAPPTFCPPVHAARTRPRVGPASTPFYLKSAQPSPC